MIYIKRLLKAAFFLTTGLLYIYNDWDKAIVSWAKYKSEFFIGAIDILVFVMTVTSLIFLVKGAYYLMTLHIEEHPTFDRTFSQMMEGGGTPIVGKSAFDKLLAYRESKLSAMSTSDAATEYLKTSWIDGYVQSNGSVRSYLDSKLSAMSTEQGYNWIKSNACNVF